MSLIAFVFPNLRTPKTWLDKYLKSHQEKSFPQAAW